MLPFESFASDLSTLVNRHLGSSEDAIVGWCLLVDKECQMLKVAKIFFDRFLRTLVRCLVANLPATHCIQNEETVNGLAEEISDLTRPLVGLIVLREWDRAHLTTEYCGYQCALSKEDCLELLLETALDKVADCPSASGSHLLPHLAELDPIALSAIDEEVSITNSGFLSLGELDGDGASGTTTGPKAKRTTSRKRRPSVSSDTSLFSPLSPPLPSPLPKPRALGTTLLSALNVAPCEVEFICEHRDRSRGNHATAALSAAEQATLGSSIAMKEAKVKLLYNLGANPDDTCADHDESLEGYRRKGHEYELLTTIYKILSQPDEALLRKLSSLEDYEERMRKLGTRLKNALTPEDLLKTLASIKTPVPSPDRT